MHGVQTFQALAGDMGVDLGCRNVGMAEQQLDDAQVGTVVEQVGCEGVAQDMWGQLFRRDVGDQGLVLD